MNKTKYIVAKYLVYGTLGLLLAVLQNVPELLAIGHTKPMLALGLAVAVAMWEGEFAGALFGGYCGFLCDVFAYTVPGYYALMLFLCCLGVGLLVHGYVRSMVVNCLLFTFFTILLIQSIAFFFLFLIRGYDAPQTLYLYHIFPLCAYTALAGIPLFGLVRGIHHYFGKRLAV